MDLMTIILYTVFFSVFIYYVSNAVSLYIFNKHHGWFTYIAIFLFQLICPLLYSIFSVGSIIFMYRAFSIEMHISWMAPIFYILCGSIFMVQPFSDYINDRKLRKYFYFLTLFWIGIGISILLINPVWNNQLERNLEMDMPSIGLFFILTNCFSIAMMLLYFKYPIYQNNNNSWKWRGKSAEIE